MPSSYAASPHRHNGPPIAYAPRLFEPHLASPFSSFPRNSHPSIKLFYGHHTCSKYSSKYMLAAAQSSTLECLDSMYPPSCHTVAGHYHAENSRTGGVFPPPPPTSTTCPGERAGSRGLKHAPHRIYNVVLRVSLSDGLLFSKKYWRALSFLSRPIAVRVLCHANDLRSTKCRVLNKMQSKLHIHAVRRFAVCLCCTDLQANVTKHKPLSAVIRKRLELVRVFVRSA